jgi:hypothetical protein
MAARLPACEEGCIMAKPPCLTGRSLACALQAMVWAGLLLGAGHAAAQAPLHQRIDLAIAHGKLDFDANAAPLASDAEFLRRVSLDLAGTIPTAAEARAFLADPSPNKRAQLIDRLLASPAYARHMQQVFDGLLMDRRPAKHVPLVQWQEYLRRSFAENKPYDQLVRELLSADGTDPKQRPAARFVLDREVEPHLLTRDVSRLFLGMNLQCAQCHDHPLVNAYHQEHYYGVYAFFSRSFLFQDKGRKQAVLAEKAEGEVSFQSVFPPKVTKSTGPRLPAGPPLAEPKLEKGKEYVVAPAKGARPVPAFSRRAPLAGLLASGANERFTRTAANRLWALLMGRGLVQPLDFDHEANPPSHPELLKLLTEDLAAAKLDIKGYLRELMLSKTYQRASAISPGRKELPEENAFAIAPLRPLSPEQLAFSVMQATGLVDVERKALGPKGTEAALASKLAASAAPFIAVFGGQPGEPADGRAEPTLAQALFLRNGPLINGWLAPRGDNLTARLAKLSDGRAVAEELYLSVLTRLPSDEERKEVSAFLGARSADRPVALQELAWALLTSAEFRFNH